MTAGLLLCQDVLNSGEPDKILEISEFSMLRLNDIGEQRKLFSSVDDIPYAHDSDSEFDEPYEQSMDKYVCAVLLSHMTQDWGLAEPYQCGTWQHLLTFLPRAQG